MKGSVLGFGSIAIILVLSIYVIVYSTMQRPYEDYVATREGELVSFGNFNNFFLKTFNQSVEFISKRVAYELAKNGGFNQGEEVYWNIYYPQIPDLVGNLERAIRTNLPSYYKKLNRTVRLMDARINVNGKDQYFDVTGSANFSITDDSIRAQTLSYQPINSRVYSSYFRLLRAAREILENETFNSSLGDANALLAKLRAETLSGGRFYGLNFEITASEDILYVTIKDICNPNTYCLAPLYSDEPKVLKWGSDFIPYDYVKLNFRIKAAQTGVTPSVCDYLLDLNPKIDSMTAYDQKNPGPTITVTNTGTTNDIVGLTAKIYDAIGNLVGPSAGISVDFADNSKPISYSTSMIIKTVNTPSGVYTINVTADGCSPNVERFVIYKLTVNPSMTFSISVVPNSIKLIRSPGYKNSTKVIVNITSGTAEPVNLYFDSLPPGISYSLDTNNAPPDFSSILNLTTNGTTPSSTYPLTIKGYGGGSYNQTSFNLIVEEPFDFTLSASPNNAAIFKTQSVLPLPQITVSRTVGTPQPVRLTFSILNSSHLPSPDNFNISVNFFNNPCTPNPPTYNCYPTMRISTNPFTPPDTYQITIYGNTSTGMPSPLPWTTFSLTVKNPECLDMASAESTDCIATKGPVGPCKYYTCDALACNLHNRDKVVPPGAGCGTEPCNNFCNATSGKRYSNPTNPNYNRVCNDLASPFAGTCNNTFDVGRCGYTSINTCPNGCKDATNCLAGALGACTQVWDYKSQYEDYCKPFPAVGSAQCMGGACSCNSGTMYETFNAYAYNNWPSRGWDNWPNCPLCCGVFCCCWPWPIANGYGHNYECLGTYGSVRYSGGWEEVWTDSLEKDSSATKQYSTNSWGSVSCSGSDCWCTLGVENTTFEAYVKDQSSNTKRYGYQRVCVTSNPIGGNKVIGGCTRSYYSNGMTWEDCTSAWGDGFCSGISCDCSTGTDTLVMNLVFAWDSRTSDWQYNNKVYCIV
jgi:hypothetical protein